MQRRPSTDRDDGSTQSHPFSNTGSQDTTITTSTDPAAFTPPASDASNCAPGPSSQDSQLLQLSEIAAAQDRIGTINSNTRKRMADGEVKSRTESQSPVKGHTRTPSAVSRTSAGGHIGELSNELRTRLSYAMVKVNNGWQSNSLEEVENMASQAASPVSSTSTIHRRQGSSASPRIPMGNPPSSSAPLPQASATERRKSHTPPNHIWHKPSLAPPAPIRPGALSAPHVNPRRNSHPYRTPGMLSHSNSDSPHTPGQQATFQHGPKFRVTGDTVLMSPHQNVREQDAIETLLFMSSPGNSANLKHAFSPPSSSAPNIGMNRPQARHALPSGPRKPLPSQRQPQQVRKSPYDNSSMPPPPGSPMDLDSPQQQHYPPQNRAMPRRRTIGGRSQLRGTLSLPSGIGIGNGKTRKSLRDEDIERMLDQASAETGDSSDDEEILIPSRRPVAGVMRS
ncbi:hypothetical protein FLAG1_06014 [Fusarium langsethiae]|uniref:Cyclin-dependent kinase n=1 Tax=Fusarium langsethiae TaxID=179993 RepID=A0A0N0DEG0_FUSLA|nr:hypothetical protein FLAG1_06014 [Fusarium langsethiae]GKU03363.1 unnamed protein product [Fusarium langsethiae]GKU20003.1 unnamed protein product [Fusarium langsethiae]